MWMDILQIMEKLQSMEKWPRECESDGGMVLTVLECRWFAACRLSGRYRQADFLHYQDSYKFIPSS
jgi:hypothetical protein